MAETKSKPTPKPSQKAPADAPAPAAGYRVITKKKDEHGTDVSTRHFQIEGGPDARQGLEADLDENESIVLFERID